MNEFVFAVGFSEASFKLKQKVGGLNVAHCWEIPVVVIACSEVGLRSVVEAVQDLDVQIGWQATQRGSHHEAGLRILLDESGTKADCR